MVRPVPLRTAGPNAPAQSAFERSVRPVIWFVAACLGALGLLERLWLLWHRSINSDEAVVGLMARDILHGHFTAFYWGQDYGGVEPYVTAAMFGVFGQNDVTLNLAPAVLSAVASLLVWRIARYALADSVAALVGLATWVWPVAVVVYSTQESGFRYATLTLGLAAVLFAVQIRCTGSTPLRWLFLGLSIGACIWSSPESVYFVVPCALLAVPALKGRATASGDSLPMLIGAFASGVVIGALPLIWVAASRGPGVIVHPTGATYPGSTPGSRFSAFFRHSGPIATGIQRPITGTWLGGAALGRVVIVVVLAADRDRFRARAQAPARIGARDDPAREFRGPLPALLRGVRSDGLLERRALRRLPALCRCHLWRIRLVAHRVAGAQSIRCRRGGGDRRGRQPLRASAGDAGFHCGWARPSVLELS